MAYTPYTISLLSSCSRMPIHALRQRRQSARRCSGAAISFRRGCSGLPMELRGHPPPSQLPARRHCRHRQRCQLVRASLPAGVSAVTANAAAAWSSTSAALHALALRLGIASGQIGAYLPFLPAAAAALQSSLGELSMPGSSIAGECAVWSQRAVPLSFDKGVH